MRVLVAGASGAIGKRLVPVLVRAGHQVIASTRTPGKTDALRALGAEPVVFDGLDAAAVARAVEAVRPEAIVHQMTSLASMRSLRRIDEEFVLTNRLRTEGTRHLLDAARRVGTRVFVAQSYTGWPNAREGGRVKTEDDPLDTHPPATLTKMLEAIVTLEAMVLGAPDVRGVALRYGSLYGPGTSLTEDGEYIEAVRKRRLPIVGDGNGVWSFIHVDDAAVATQLAVESDASGVYNIVDDEPAEARVWLPELARALNAKPPRHVPAWIGRLFLGEAGLLMMTKIRGSSNAKARRTLGWTLRYPTWRDGFRHGLADE